MNILVYGAGVIGSVYAARLQEAGYHVSLLARGQRAQAIRVQGILLEDGAPGQGVLSLDASLVHCHALAIDSANAYLGAGDRSTYSHFPRRDSSHGKRHYDTSARFASSHTDAEVCACILKNPCLG